MKEEIFTVGEEVITNNGRGKHKILGFKIIDGDMCVDLEGFACQYEFLSKIKKSPTQPKEETKPIWSDAFVFEKPKPLFITEDGVEIFDGEMMVWYVSQFRLRERKAKNAAHLGNKRFYTQKAAEDYIYNNKPQFSYSDVQVAMQGNSVRSADGSLHIHGSNTLTKLHSIAKQKNQQS